MLHRNNLLYEVKELIEEGADVNLQDEEGKTPLHYYVTYEVAKYLIDNGARIDILDKYGKTPIQYDKSYEVSKLLIDHGADGSNVEIPLLFRKNALNSKLEEKIIPRKTCYRCIIM